MPLDISRESLLNWKPTLSNVLHGARTYAKRELIYASRIEKTAKKIKNSNQDGYKNLMEQALLRMAKAKDFCLSSGLEWPPGSTPKTAAVPCKFWGLDLDVPCDWQEGRKFGSMPVPDVVIKSDKYVPTEDTVPVEVPESLPHHVPHTEKLMTPTQAKKKADKLMKKQRKQWSGDAEYMRLVGRVGWLNRLVANGEMEKAAAFRAKHGITDEMILRVSHGVRGEPETASVVGTDGGSEGASLVEAHETATLSTSSDGAAAATAVAGTSDVIATVAPSEPVSEPVVAVEAAHEPVEAPKPQVPMHKLSLREQLLRQLAEMDAAERAAGRPTPTPAAKPAVKVEVAAPVTEPVAAPVATPVVPPAAPMPKGMRKAKVWRFAVNPRLAVIKFMDGAEEFGSLFLGRRQLRLNDVVEVVVAQGEGPNAIWEEPKKAV